MNELKLYAMIYSRPFVLVQFLLHFGLRRILSKEEKPSSDNNTRAEHNLRDWKSSNREMIRIIPNNIPYKYDRIP